MIKKLAVFVVLWMSIVVRQQQVLGGKLHRFRGEGGGGASSASTMASQFLSGNLGTLPRDALQHVGEGFTTVSDDRVIQRAAQTTLYSILRERLGAMGDEVVKPLLDRSITKDALGNIHVPFRQFIHGHAVEGATMWMHIHTHDGAVFALNGAFSPSNVVNLQVKLTCNQAVERALQQSGIAEKVATTTWLSPCQETAVQGFDGYAHLAYKRIIGYLPPPGPGPNGGGGDRQPYQQTLVFASTDTGELLAWHPLIRGAAAQKVSLETWDCKGTQLGEYCRVKSNSSKPLTEGNPGVVDAHNYALVVHDYYKTEFGRDSLDDKGLKVVSFANVGTENNAAWNSQALNIYYGGGDGIEFYPFSFALDVVAHEFTHAVTQFSSNLIYADESGAINEAISDIFGAVIERSYLKKSVNNTWLLGEDLFIHGGAIRNMQDPAAYDNVDYYPDRALEIDFFTDTVHNNSGIANLAFALMVQGGKHPRGKTNIDVPALIDNDFDKSLQAAASIFYSANTQCLSESSTFYSLRVCTLMFAENNKYKKSVGAAWDAVGVVEQSFTELTNNVELKGQSANWNEVREYSLSNVQAGETVTCTTEGNNGDADLYIRYGGPVDARFASYMNDCVSGTDGPNEKCSTSVTPRDATAYVGVLAYEDFSKLSITCFRTLVTSETELGVPVSVQSGKKGTVNYFAIDLSHFQYNLYDGTFQCAAFASKGKVDLFFKFGALPSPKHDATNDCESGTTKNKANPGSSSSKTESCFTNYTFNGIKSSYAFAAVSGKTTFKGLEVQCNQFFPPQDVGYGSYIPVSLGRVSQFYLKGVKAGETVRCTLVAEESGAYVGDADLYVRLGQQAEPYSWSTANDCQSVTPTSNEVCTTKPATKSTTAYVAVTTTKPANRSESDSYYYYGSGFYVTLECTSSKVTCLAKGEICTSQDTCCSVGGKDSTCDGPNEGPSTCKTCKVAPKICIRDSQCCSGNCLNNKCTDSKK